MDHEQFKGLILSFLQNVDETFASQALLALGHGQCSANADLREHLENREAEIRKLTQRLQDAENHIEKLQQAHPHPQAQTQAQAQPLYDAQFYKNRADQAEADCQWYKNRVDELEGQQQRASVYAMKLSNVYEMLRSLASETHGWSSDIASMGDGIWNLMSEQGDQDKL